MKFSVFTPTHRKTDTFIRQAWESLLEQSYLNWEWVIIPNNGGVVPNEIRNDPRVKLYPFTGDSLPDGRNSIGALKKFACERCTGDVLVELDDDDLLTPNALEELARVYANPAVQMAYSNDATFRNDFEVGETFSAYWGWKYRDFEYKGHKLVEAVAWPPGPWPFRQIFWSPDHLRSWRVMGYRAIGGHDPTLDIADDFDLNARSYLAWGAHGIRHIDKCLYLYRNQDASTCHTHAYVLRETDQSRYEKYVEHLAWRWAKDEGLGIYDLGGGLNPRPGYISVDKRPEANIQCDLEGRWPFEENSVGVLRAYHVFEHLSNPIHTMNEAYRVLAPGGWLFIEVPSTDGRGAFQDPTHRSFWNYNSFAYYTDESMARFIQPEYTGRFQVSCLADYNWAEHIVVTRADLIALKPPYDGRCAGEIKI